MSGITINVEGLTLVNLADGKVSDRFQEELERIAHAFDDDTLTEGRHSVKASVSITTELKFIPETGAVSITAKVSRAKLPEPRKRQQQAIFRNGRFSVEPEDEQMEMLEPNRPHRDVV